MATSQYRILHFGSFDQVEYDLDLVVVDGQFWSVRNILDSWFFDIPLQPLLLMPQSFPSSINLEPAINTLRDDHVILIAPPSNAAPTTPPILGPMLPSSRPAPSEHSAETWEHQRLIFTQPYIIEDRPLKEVMRIMEDKHGFRAT